MHRPALTPDPVQSLLGKLCLLLAHLGLDLVAHRVVGRHLGQGLSMRQGEGGSRGRGACNPLSMQHSTHLIELRIQLGLLPLDLLPASLHVPHETHATEVVVTPLGLPIKATVR